MTPCTNCGAENPAGQKFCGECGIALAATCGVCGSTNPPGQKFCGECGSPLGVTAAAADQAPQVAVERRLVSVLFADLVGFTPLSEQRDAEDVRDLLSRYFELAAGIVGRYGGVVEKFIGDAVMAVWGTPVAQEDDAERAVRAAIDVVAAVAEFGPESGMEGLAARAGVLTGEAAVNLGAAGQGMVAGDLVNAASRVQAAADPGTVLVGESTRRASEAAIAYADAGLHELKGKADAMQLWRAVRVTAGRAGGLKSKQLEPPFVGRDRELRLAKELFHASADEHKAHLLSITGIAGIGKSRLAWELYKYLDGITQDVAWHRGRCLAYGEGVTFWALAEMVRMRAGIAEGEDASTAGPKLDAALESSVHDAEERGWIRPRLFQLASLEARENLEQADLFAGWRLFFERIAEREPVVLVFEDMQWADKPLLEFVAYLLEWSRNSAVLVLALARPELADRHANWAGGLRNATALSLEPLSADAMDALLDGFVPGLPGELRRQIQERSEGVPLYAVETVRMLLDRGLLEQAGGEYRPTGPIEALDVPETLQALIAARLDGLPSDERGLLQDAAVLGKTFTKPALEAVSGLGDGELGNLLAALVRKEVLSLQADPRSPERGQYSFLQDLLRQVAYETLPRKERKARHLAAAAYLEQQGLDGDGELVEIVAAHVLSALDLDPDAKDAAELRSRAEAILVRAGERAAVLGAPESAQRYFEQAIELAESPLRQAELHERAGQMAVLGLHGADARSHFQSAIDGFERLGLTHSAARVTSRIGLLTWRLEGIEQAIADLQGAFDVLAGEERDADLAMLAVTLARPLFFSRRVDDAMARNELALEIAESLQLPEVLSHGLNTKGLILSARGRHEEAELLSRHALAIALTNDLSGPALRAYINLTAIIVGRNRYREALALSLEGRELAMRIGDRDGELWLGNWVRTIRLALGEWDEVLAEEEKLDAEEDGRPPWWLLNTVFTFVHRGEIEEAKRRIEEARPQYDRNEAQTVAGFKSAEAEVLLAEGRTREALEAAEEAVAVSEDLAAGLSFAIGGYVVALEAAFSLRDDAKVDELLAIVERLSPGELTPELRAFGAHFSARRAALRGDRGSADAGFGAATRIYREIETPFELALVLLEHAEWLAGDGRLEETEPLAAEAREIFERLRTTPYLERLDRLQTGAAAVR